MTKPNEPPATKSKPAPKPPGAHLAFRAPAEVIARLDADAATMRAERPGVTYTRSDAAREAVLRGLARGRGVAPDVEV